MSITGPDVISEYAEQVRTQEKVLPPPSKTKFKKPQIFVDTILSDFYMFYPWAEISHWNGLLSGKLEFLKMWYVRRSWS